MPTNDQAAFELDSNSPQQTEAIGRALGLAAEGGELLGLIGELGAGKTRLVKGIAAGLGLKDQGQVRSPTFVLIREHPGRLRLFHVDAYRLQGPAELLSLGLDEILDHGGLTAVEWADRVGDLLPPDRLDLDFAIIGSNQRRITFRCGGMKAISYLDRIREHLPEELAAS